MKADVYGVGNSLVDTLAFVDQDFVREHDLEKFHICFLMVNLAQVVMASAL
jgi:hypothetical protein